MTLSFYSPNIKKYIKNARIVYNKVFRSFITIKKKLKKLLPLWLNPQPPLCPAVPAPDPGVPPLLPGAVH